MIYPTEWPQFYTATILNWQHLLQEDKYKDIVVESLQFCVKENKIRLYPFICFGWCSWFSSRLVLMVTINESHPCLGR
jgi:hypothetical protein